MAIDTLGANALATGSVTSAKIADGAVVAADVADGSVTTAKLADDAVTSAKLGASAVDTTAIASNAVTTAKVSDGAVTQVKTTGVGRGKNFLINGDMNVAQRGNASGAQNFAHDGQTYAYGPVDRFRWGVNDYETLDGTVTRSTDVPSGQRFKSSMKWTTGTVEANSNQGTEYLYTTQKIEASNCQSLRYGTTDAQQTTLSFWVKSSVTGTFACGLYKNDQTTRVHMKTYAISSANTWEKKTITYAADTGGGGIDNDSGEGIWVVWHLAAADGMKGGDSSSGWSNYSQSYWANGHNTNAIPDTSGATWYITGAQFEVGTLATDFEHKPFHENLRDCMRYYYQSNYGSQFTTGDLYFGRNDTQLLIAFPENMRANPSVTTCTDVSLPSGGGSGHYVVHGTGNYTNGANLHSTPNQFTMYTPNGSSSQPTKTGFKADAEI